MTGPAYVLILIPSSDALMLPCSIGFQEVKLWFIVIFTVIFYQPKLISNLPQ